MQTIFSWSLYIICSTNIVVFSSLESKHTRRTITTAPQGTCVKGLCSCYCTCTVALDMHNACCTVYAVSVKLVVHSKVPYKEEEEHIQIICKTQNRDLSPSVPFSLILSHIRAVALDMHNDMLHIIHCVSVKLHKESAGLIY